MSELRVAAFAQFAKKEWQDHCNFVDIEGQKLISHSLIRWQLLYPSLPRMLQMYPASPILHVHRQINCCSVTLFWKFSERSLFNTLRHAIICGCFRWASSEYWEVKSINCWGCIVFCHWEGKNSSEAIRYSYIKPS